MSEASFTKGPWKASATEPPGEYVIHAPGSPWGLAYVFPSKDAKKTFPVEANAHLIAAAPELFEALTETRKWMDADELGPWEAKFCAKIDALLAKARGAQ